MNSGNHEHAAFLTNGLDRVGSTIFYKQYITNSALHKLTSAGKYMHIEMHIVEPVFRKWQLRTLEKQIWLLGTDCNVNAS